MLKPVHVVRRSACDQCRTKRVRCLRAQESMAPCARCSYIGAQCVTGAPGHPGRPPKQRLADRNSTPRSKSTAASPDQSNVSSPPTPNPDPHSHPHRISTRDNEPNPNFWATAGDTSSFFGFPWIDSTPQPGGNACFLSLPDQASSSSPSQSFQALLGIDDDLSAMLHMGGDSTPSLDMHVFIDPLLDHVAEVAPPATPTPLSVASSLAGFREEIEKRIARVDAFYSDNPKAIVQRCKDEGGAAGRDVENPAASLLTCTEEFIGIIQSLMPPPTPQNPQAEDAPSTEVVLQILSSYLALMRLFDCLFHRIYKFLCQVPPASYQSVKVKSVLRVGGISSLQDMPLKAYAIGILDTIQCKVKTLERCMGIPAEYCLSGEAAPAASSSCASSSSSSTVAPGIFSRADRARLFWAVMAQEDLKSWRSSKSYVESIRASIERSMAFVEDHLRG